MQGHWLLADEGVLSLMDVVAVKVRKFE